MTKNRQKAGHWRRNSFVKKSHRFFEKSMKVKIHNLSLSLKCHHMFIWFHRVYGFQNNWLDITIIQADMVWETMHRSLIYLWKVQNCKYLCVQHNTLFPRLLVRNYTKNMRSLTSQRWPKIWGLRLVRRQGKKTFSD